MTVRSFGKDVQLSLLQRDLLNLAVGTIPDELHLADAGVEPSGRSMRARTKCLSNTTGPLCASCVDGFGKAAGKCVPCPAFGTQAAAMLAFR